jgi:hypothetical protein
MKPRRKLRKQITAFRKRKFKPRKLIGEEDEDIMVIAVGSPEKGK